ncbi:MAG: hypothetical protein EBR09_01230 [Proteobacteria bacterium]|nr:hypothetical protein [Pseudomonadota bacterium]
MFLADLSRDGELPESVLGLGFFAAQAQAAGMSGVELSVSPVFLKDTLLRAVARETLLPFSSEPIFLGASDFAEDRGRMRNLLRRKSDAVDARSIRRWILTGIHPFFGSGESPLKGSPWCAREIAESQGISDTISIMLREMFRRVLNLRASTVVLAPDTEMLETFLSAFARWRLSQGNFVRLRDYLRLRPADRMELILREILVWLVEESLNDRVTVLCRTSLEHEQLILASRYILRNTAISQPIQFRL